MQGLSVRIAKAMNRLMGTRGAVLGDHYHAHLLETPTKLVNAIAYVLGNAARHYGIEGRPRSRRLPATASCCSASA
jgi:putative transposase